MASYPEISFLRLEANQWQSGLHQKTTAYHADTTQCHGETGPDRIQSNVGAITDNWIEDACRHWHGNAIIDQCPGKVELDPSEDDATEVDKC